MARGRDSGVDGEVEGSGGVVVRILIYACGDDVNLKRCVE